MSKETIVPVDVNKNFLEAISNIGSISKNIVIKPFNNDRVGVVQRSKGGEITCNLSVPSTSFTYNKEVAIKNFPSFYKTYGLLENPRIEIKERNDDVPFAIIAADDDTQVDFSLEKPTAIRSGKINLPPLAENDHIIVTLKDESIRVIKTLTSSLIVDKAESGTRLNVTYTVDTNELSLEFVAVKALGNSFTKKYTPEVKALNNFKLSFDPLFFTWLPNGDYDIIINNGGRAFIQAKFVDKDKDVEKATYVFTAGAVS